MRIIGYCLISLLTSIGAIADTQVVNGVTYECTDGLCRMISPEPEPTNNPSANLASVPSPDRIAQGYMSADQFLDFLNGIEHRSLPTSSSVALILFLLVAGLAMNLTPCVLPMIPINLIVIGRSVRRGFLYGFGQALAYGALGVAASVGGLAFGTIQSHPLFSAAVSVVFAILSLALFGVFPIDFTRFRPSANGRLRALGAIFPFAMGVLSAVLAGACVAPVLVSVLLLTANLYASGHVEAIGLPFVLGIGLALPWPFLGAGIKILPRPGAWMIHVNRVFAVIVLGFAAWYALLAVQDFRHRFTTHPPVADAHVSRNQREYLATPATLANVLATIRASDNNAKARHPILVDCWASWCKNCAAMERGTLKDQKIINALKDWHIIRLQAEDISALRQLPDFGQIHGLPAFAIFR